MEKHRKKHQVAPEEPDDVTIWLSFLHQQLALSQFLWIY